MAKRSPLQARVGGSTPTSSPQSPRQFTFVRTANKDGAALNEQWHSALPYIPVFHIQFSFVAEWGGKPYAVGLWGRPVARTLDDAVFLELRRMAICAEAPKNTASCMLAWMVRELREQRPEIQTFISYQDTARHTGTIYRAAGWYPIHLRSPVNWDGSAQTKKAPSRKRNGPLLKAPKVRWQRDA